MKRIVLCLALLVPISGCKTITATPTPGVTQFYSQAALLLSDFSNVLNQANQLFTSAHTLALVSDADYKAGEQVFLQIAKNGDAITTLIKAGGDEVTVKSQLQALATQVSLMPSSFHITNPASQAQFTALIQSLSNILSAVQTLV